jgi:hypothetical protein
VSFPKWRNPEVSEDTREELEAARAKTNHEFEVMQRNRQGMAAAMIRKGILFIPTTARLKDGRSRHAK